MTQNWVLTDGLKPPFMPPGMPPEAKDVKPGPVLKLKVENPPGIPPPNGLPPLEDGGGGPPFKPKSEYQHFARPLRQCQGIRTYLPLRVGRICRAYSYLSGEMISGRGSCI